MNPCRRIIGMPEIYRRYYKFEMEIPSDKLLSSQGVSRESIWNNHYLNKFLGTQDITDE